MKIKYILLLLIIAGFCGAYSFADQNKGAAELQIDGGRRGDVGFPHAGHQKVINDCNVCHGDYPQVKGVIPKMKKEGTLKRKQIMNTQCLKCHRQKKKAGEKTGPVSCSKCHKRS